MSNANHIQHLTANGNAYLTITKPRQTIYMFLLWHICWLTCSIPRNARLELDKSAVKTAGAMLRMRCRWRLAVMMITTWPQNLTGRTTFTAQSISSINHTICNIFCKMHAFHSRQCLADMVCLFVRMFYIFAKCMPSFHSWQCLADTSMFICENVLPFIRHKIW